jgi:hypothetical protein
MRTYPPFAGQCRTLKPSPGEFVLRTKASEGPTCQLEFHQIEGEVLSYSPYFLALDRCSMPRAVDPPPYPQRWFYWS